MDDFFTQLWNLVQVVADPRNLRHPEAYRDALAQPGVMWSAFAAAALVVFTETGLLIGFLLPGDSLLVVLGIVARTADWPILPLMLLLAAAAVIGDTVGYHIGWKAGPALFNRPSSRFFKRDHLLKARAFYDRHGGKTIVIARFIPIVRTFVPVVAGAARMEYRTFLAYNVAGGVGWIVSMLLLGYMLDPLLQQVFGPQFQIAKHIDKVIVVVVGLSVLPIVWKAYKGWRAGQTAPAATAAAAAPGVVAPPADAVESAVVPPKP